ncbi:hypothetical protein [Mycobacterium heckeshornense]|uniref:Uncharacterized protein n=1 Tax=Mycobacterium heckeshornense TaxID=110505 RepID=A0A2I3EHW2_9MYCO|nr:hypothetical protein [Mycobacterium heckeshornense]KMV16452.1 hypothetical protein ACT16_22395 [Mycobacterium heckeshornense]BCO36410.1 hypothetical protein MHEC_28430 [Mycobacterium heckeshornense]
MPKNAQVEVKADYWAIFDVPENIEPGRDAVAYVHNKIDAFEKRWRDPYPAAVWAVLDRASAGWRGFTMRHPPGCGYYRICEGRCITNRPNCRNGIREFTPKLVWREPIPPPSHRIVTASERNTMSELFTPLLERPPARKAELRYRLAGAGVQRVVSLGNAFGLASVGQGLAHWCTMPVSVIVDGLPMHPRRREVIALLA